MQVHFSSNRMDWATPRWVYDRIVGELSPEPPLLDVCASIDNRKCTRYYGEEDNALVKPWDDSFWMNPPYGRGIGQWVQRAMQQAQEHTVIGTCLLPARTDTAWWHDYVMEGAALVYLIRGRIKFELPDGAENSAPFPSAVVIFDPWHPGPVYVRPWCLHGRTSAATLHGNMEAS